MSAPTGREVPEPDPFAAHWQIKREAPAATLMPRFLVYADMHGRLVSAHYLATHGLHADVIGSRLSAWVRAPSRERAKEYVASHLHRAGYPVDPIALTVPVYVEGDEEPTPNAYQEITP